MSTRGQIWDLYYEIAADVDDGECFYNKKMLDNFINNLENMKALAIQYYNENQEELEGEL